MAQRFFCRLILAHNFLIESDNGRSSLRIANTFSLEVPSIELAAIDNNIRLHLKPYS
jgi:hypothetical protein